MASSAFNEKSSKASVTSISFDLSVEAGAWPDENRLGALVEQALDAAICELALGEGASELSIVFTDDAHIRVLNAQWRKKDKPTNVLSFPAMSFQKGETLLPPLLGDIVLAFETIRDEAKLDEKPFEHHVTHLVVHGLLHLLGYDHESDGDAEEMETLEKRVLLRLSIDDPYR